LVITSAPHFEQNFVTFPANLSASDNTGKKSRN
jgi:hypothetical protein